MLPKPHTYHHMFHCHHLTCNQTKIIMYSSHWSLYKTENNFHCLLYIHWCEFEISGTITIFKFVYASNIIAWSAIVSQGITKLTWADVTSISVGTPLIAIPIIGWTLVYVLWSIVGERIQFYGWRIKWFEIGHTTKCSLPFMLLVLFQAT